MYTVELLNIGHLQDKPFCPLWRGCPLSAVISIGCVYEYFQLVHCWEISPPLSEAQFTLGVLIGFNPLPVMKLVPIHQWLWIESIQIEPDWWAFTLISELSLKLIETRLELPSVNWALSEVSLYLYQWAQ